MVTPLWVLNTIKNCAPGKSGPKFTKIFQGMLPPKSSHHTKFHRDRSNQLGDRGVSIGPWTNKLFVTDRNVNTSVATRKCARGATKNEPVSYANGLSCMECNAGMLSEIHAKGDQHC